MTDLKQEVKELFSQVVEWRRHFHQHAELSFEEFQTSDYIEEKLKEFGGIEIKRPTKTGVVGIIEGALPGPTIALRCDIDALPMTEKQTTFLLYRKTRVQCTHADMTDMPQYFSELQSSFLKRKAQLHGKLICIFQHAEELPPGGAIELVKAGVMEGVDEVFGLHLSSNYPTGKYGFVNGALTSATDGFDIKVIGKGGHSSMPEQCIDPVITAAQIVLALQNIRARKISTYDKAVISVCTIHGGDAYNIIPGEVKISGSVRTFSKEVRAEVEKQIKQISNGIAAANGAECEVSYDKGYDSVVNNEQLTDEAREAVRDWFGEDAVLEILPVMPGEDFSAFTEAGNCPGCFVEIGTRNEEKGTTRPHHNPAYLMDEDELYYGLALFASVLEKKML